MREIANADRIRLFLRRLGESVREETRIYLVGGATSVLMGWRDTTVDVDLKIVPDRDEVYRAIPALKESLRINVELASPDHFLPPLPGWEDRSPFVAREGRIDWHHYDPYSQVLAKIERGHERDLLDVREFLDRKLVEPAKLREMFQQIVPDLIRYPAVDETSLRAKLDRALEGR